VAHRRNERRRHRRLVAPARSTPRPSIYNSCSGSERRGDALAVNPTTLAVLVYWPARVSAARTRASRAPRRTRYGARHTSTRRTTDCCSHEQSASGGQLHQHVRERRDVHGELHRAERRTQHGHLLLERPGRPERRRLRVLRAQRQPDSLHVHGGLGDHRVQLEQPRFVDGDGQSSPTMYPGNSWLYIGDGDGYSTGSTTAERRSAPLLNYYRSPSPAARDAVDSTPVIDIAGSGTTATSITEPRRTTRRRLRIRPDRAELLTNARRSTTTAPCRACAEPPRVLCRD